MSAPDHRQQALGFGLDPTIVRPTSTPGLHGQTNRRGQTDVWLTPPEIIDDLGPFDLDPCAAPDPRPWPTADRHYTEVEGDGCSRPWSGIVWLNPPYGGETARWLGRLAEHGTGIAFVIARTETRAWAEHVWPHASGILFPSRRFAFHRPDGTRASANLGAASALIAYGPEALERLRRSREPGALVTGWTTT